MLEETSIQTDQIVKFLILVLVEGKISCFFSSGGVRGFFEKKNAFFEKWNFLLYYTNHWKNAVDPITNMKIKIELLHIQESYAWLYACNLINGIVIFYLVGILF